MANKPGLYANIAAKKARIKAGSGEKMRKVGSKGAPGQGVPDPSAIQQNVSNTAGASYVPTKMEIDITLIIY